MGGELVADFDKDINDRKDWIRTYVEGLKLLGLKYEERTEPWNGACGVFHPMLTESVVRFQSEGIMETFPAAGPVKTQILGKDTPIKEEASARVREDMKAFGAEKEEDEKEKEEAPEAEEKADEAYPAEDPEAGVEKPEIPAKSSDIGTEGAEMAADVNKFVTEPSEPKMEGEEEMKGHEEGEEELDLEAILAELEAEDEKHKASSEKMASLEKELAEPTKNISTEEGNHCPGRIHDDRFRFITN